MTTLATPDVGRQVLLIDLRDIPPESVRRRALEVLHNADRPYGRVLVIDDITALRDHHPVYQAIRSSRSVRSVICVAVGLPLEPVGGVALRATPVFSYDSHDAAMLWVGDDHGVDWRSRMAEVAIAAPDTGGHESGFEVLLELLRIDEIFDGVLKLAVAMPDRVASPGYRAVSGLLDAALLRDAEARAVSGLLDGGPDPSFDLEKVPPPYRVLLGRGRSSEGAASRRLKDDSPLARTHARAVEALNELDDRLRTAAGPAGLLRPRAAQQRVAAAARQAADDVSAWRTGVQDQFELADVADQHARDQASRAGVVLTLKSSVLTPVGVVNWLDRRVTEGLDDGESIDGLVQWMRDVADGVAPAGSAAAVPALDERCPRSTVDRLRGASRSPVPAAGPWILGAAFLACALAAVAASPVGLVTGAVAVAVWFAGTLLVLMAGHQDAVRGAVTGLAHLAVAAAGAGAGMLAGRTLDLPAGAAAGAVVSTGLLVALLLLWWRRSAPAWAAELGVEQARAAVVEVRTLLGEVALLEWTLAELRRFTSDAARVAANALDECAGELRAATAGPDDHAPAPMDDRTIPAVRQVIAGDLLDLALAAVTPCFDQLRGGVLDDSAGRTAGRTRHLLNAYRRHLDRRGPEEPPSFARSSAERSGLVRAVWEQTPAAAELLRHASPGMTMRQLCAAEDIGQLQPAGQVRLVRFAPRAAQDAFGGVAAPGDVEWTSTGSVVGVIRLVPLRPGSVELGWPSDSEAG